MRTILIDVDSVLNDLSATWFAAYNADYNDNLTPDRVHCWDTHTLVKPECGKAIYDYLRRPEIFMDAPVQPGGQAVTEVLAKTHKLYTLSSCTFVENAVVKTEWLKRWFPHITRRIWLDDRDPGKGIIAGDILIDDRFDNFQDFDGTGLLFAAPWNLEQWQAATGRQGGDRTYLRRTNRGTLWRVDGWAAIARWFGLVLDAHCQITDRTA